MPKYGASALIWIDTWNSERGAFAIAEAGRIGFDFIEIPMMQPELFEFKPIKRALETAGIGATATLILPWSLHMPQFPKKARKFLSMALENLAAVSGTHLCGSIAFAGGLFTGNLPTPAERHIVEDTLGELCQDASKRGITVALECVNRYETYLYNVLSDGRSTVKAVNATNLKLHANTFHMNIEEENFHDPLVACADVLGYFQVSESHRGLPGTGTVNWEQVFKGLRDANYQGPLVLESFSGNNAKLVSAVQVWRPPKHNPEALATGGLKFMREWSQKVGL